MPAVTVVNRGNQAFDVKQGRTVLTGARENGQPWRWYCGGEALCGTCCMIVVDGELEPPNDVERYFIEGWGYHPSFRLACQARVKEPVSVISCADEGYNSDTVLAAYENAMTIAQGETK
ncbi:MAG: 2Fe-2S iron-sulfur cluster-binding protein [Alphaproteobacteria bacterium]